MSIVTPVSSARPDSLHTRSKSVILTLGLAGVIVLFSSVLYPAVGLANEAIWKGVYKYQLKLANNGNAEAQFKLGGMYEDGQGVEQNFDEARHWYEKSAALGYQPAIERLRGLDGRIDMAAERARREEEARLAREQAERDAEQRRLEQERRHLEALKAAEERRARAQAEAERLEREIEERKQRLVEEKEVRRKASEAAIRQAEKAWQEAVERRVAEERAHAEMRRQMAMPSAFDD